MNISVEKTPRQWLNKYVIDSVDFVSVTHLECDTFYDVVEACIEINDIAGEIKSIPHIAVRNINSKSELVEGLDKIYEIGIERVLLIGGNKKLGKVYQTVSEIESMIDYYNFEKIGAIYPQRQTTKDFLNSNFTEGITQLSFDKKLLKKWINEYPKSVRIGIPSHCSIRGLIKYLKMCGLLNSFSYAVNNLKGISYLRGNKFDTKKFCDTLGAENIHVYNFGNLTETIKQLKNHVQFNRTRNSQ